MNLTYSFPKNFLWGSATSGPQSEGSFNKPHKNIFDHWFEISPKTFFNEVGPSVTSNFYNSYKEDLRLLKEIGLNSYRTSIQWTRLIKDFETGEPSLDGVEFYNNVINESLSLGITPIINLHHFDLPIELYEKYGGFESKHVVNLFAKYAKTAFSLFGDRVKLWTTFNEPIVIVEGQYLYKFHYPLIVNGKKATQVLFNLNLASAMAINEFKNLHIDGQIGIILNLTPTYPRSSLDKDLEASNIADLFFNRSFLDPAIHGEFPKELSNLLEADNVLWESSKEELNIIKNNTIDFLGVNYYQPRRVKAKESTFTEDTWMPDKYFDLYEMPERRMNPYRGWEIYPEAMFDISMNIKNNYKNIPWFISENGMGVENEERYINSLGVIEDDYRIDFFKEHLSYLHKGIEAGSNCFGFHSWTPIDCWSWCNAYKNRYGFISLNLTTLEKTIKKSGRWICEVSKNNGF